MKVKTFTLRFHPEEGFDDRELTRFCEEHEAISVTDHFFFSGEAPWWAIMIGYREVDHGKGARRETLRGKDHRKLLQGDDRILYDTLREWRSLRAGAEGVPPYLLFTNKQLAEISRNRPESKSALRNVEGVGPAKLEKYAADVFEVLRSISKNGNDSQNE